MSQDTKGGEARKIGGYEVHPAADVWPMLADDKLRELADDIKANGQIHPIVIVDGKLVDGRNRMVACEVAGVEPEVEHKTEAEVGDVWRYVVSANEHRRHLSTSQRAKAAVAYKKHLEGAAKQRQREHGGTAPGRKKNTSGNISRSVSKRPREIAAEACGVSGRTVQDCETVEDRGVGGLQEMVDRGEVSVANAAKVARMPKAVQETIIAGGVDAVLEAVNRRKAFYAGNDEADSPTPKSEPTYRDLENKARHLKCEIDALLTKLELKADSRIGAPEGLAEITEKASEVAEGMGWVQSRLNDLAADEAATVSEFRKTQPSPN